MPHFLDFMKDHWYLCIQWKKSWLYHILIMLFFTKNSKAATNSSSVTMSCDHHSAVFFIQNGMFWSVFVDLIESGMIMIFSWMRCSIPLINSESEIWSDAHHLALFFIHSATWCFETWKEASPTLEPR